MKEVDKLIAEAILEDKNVDYDKYYWYISEDINHIDSTAIITSINKMYVLYGYDKEKILESEFR